MAIAYDSSVQASNGSSSPWTWSHTVTGTRPFLFVAIESPNALSASTVTYNGVAMTLLDSTNYTGTRYGYLYYLANPATGTNTVSVTDASISNTQGGSVSYTGVKTLSPIDNNRKNTATGNSVSESITTVADNCWVFLALVDATGGTNSDGSNFTSRIGSQGQRFIMGDTNAVKTPAGSVTQTMTLQNTPAYGIIQVSIEPQVTINNSLAIGQGSYSLTGQTLLLSYGRKMILSVGTYASTGFNILFTYFKKWTNADKNSSSMSNQSKTSSSWSNGTKNSSSFNNTTKN